MKPGETQLFLQHLSQQTMYIDVWDGDSLLPLGSTAVDLKVRCRVLDTRRNIESRIFSMAFQTKTFSKHISRQFMQETNMLTLTIGSPFSLKYCGAMLLPEQPK